MLFAAATCAGLLLSGPAGALEIVELSLDDLGNSTISTASRFSQRISESPSRAIVIRGDEIRSHGWSRLDEALQSVPGFEVSSATDYRFLGVRGFSQPGDYNSRILLLIDGIPSNDGIYDQAMIGAEFPVDMDLIDRIEVVTGAGSALYGGNAFLAVVNVITRRSDSVGRSVTLGAGTGGMWRGQASAGERDENGRHWLLSAARERAHGEDRFFPQWQGVEGSDGWARDLDGERLRRLFMRYGGDDWSLQLVHGRRRKEAAGALYGTDFAAPVVDVDETTQLGLRLTRPLGAGWNAEGQLYAGEYRFTGRYRYGGLWESEFARTGWLGANAQLSGRPWARQTWVLGVSLRDDYQRVQENVGGRSDNGRSTLGLYAQYNFRYSEQLNLTLGGRYDRDSLGSHQVSPRLGLIFNLPRQTVVKLLAGKAFRPPNAYESDYSYPDAQLPGGQLQPERITSTEIVLEQAIDSSGRWTASLYHNRFSNLIATVTDFESGLQQLQNIGGASTHGLELSASYRIAGGLADGVGLRGSLAWQHSEDAAGAMLPNSPQRLLKFLAVVPVGTWEVGWETYYTGPRRDVFAARVGGRTVSHAALSGRLSRRLRWQVRASNLFDQRRPTVVGGEYSLGTAGNLPTIDDYGRQVRAQLTADF